MTLGFFCLTTQASNKQASRLAKRWKWKKFSTSAQKILAIILSIIQEETNPCWCILDLLPDDWQGLAVVIFLIFFFSCVSFSIVSLLIAPMWIDPLLPKGKRIKACYPHLTFQILWALKSFDARSLCYLETSIDGFLMLCNCENARLGGGNHETNMIEQMDFSLSPVRWSLEPFIRFGTR